MRPVDCIGTFPLVNASRVLQLHEYALFLTLGISEFDVRRVLVDPGSSTDLLQMSAYKQMGYSPSALENPGMKVVPFTYYQMVRYLIEEGQVDLLGSQLATCQCYQVALDFRHPTSEEAPNKDTFAWTHSDMFGIPPSMASQSLMSHPPRVLSSKRFHVSIWIVFPYPRIDQIVDAIVRHGMLSFLNAFSGYHQILMFQPDKEKTTFITPHGLYCYKVMSFGLKNAGTTYQRLMTKIFKPLIEPNHGAELPQKPAHLVESLREQWWTLHVDETSRASSSGIANFGQIQKEYEANDERMACYLTMVKDRLEKLDKWVVRQVPRNENLKVDTLAGIATTLPIRKSSNATRSTSKPHPQSHQNQYVVPMKRTSVGYMIS
ncbi:Transposon Ty3-G Gag-Pol polyprotein [Vitis vinifera]|uniref:Transposon Ty3-G Gag-Pol polyprotein n=1 Tax=Vitis vinifera TaxID=29760 RepID=A0A438JCH0_VITVI|nr:Transposon Ty3-G Gag-Pol polyprotein [Vitis vinifera]